MKETVNCAKVKTVLFVLTQEKAMCENEFATWGDILKYLQDLTPEQLAQPPMVMPHNPDEGEVIGLLPVVMMATVEETQRETHSAEDWKHHPEQVVMLTDWHPFSSDGDFSYLLTEEGWVGDRSGKVFDDDPLAIHLVHGAQNPDDTNIVTFTVPLPDAAYEALKKLQELCGHKTLAETISKALMLEIAKRS